MTTIQWAIDLYSRRLNREDTSDTPSRNVYTRESRRLKLCPDCRNVWEMSCTGQCRRYAHFPTIRLKRSICPFCEGKDLTYKQR